MIIDNCGDKLENGNTDSFSSMFDWIITGKGVIINKKIPDTIYSKTDYLPFFVKVILPTINTPFRFATGCSDYSPMINFREEYEIITNNKFLICWYTNNCLEYHPKVKAYPGGMCRNKDSEIIELLKEKQSITKHTSNKILCCWRDRDFNVCGDKFITRKEVELFVKSRPDIFDWIDPTLSTLEFYKILKRYKYVLCPVGNGVDPCPKAFESILLKTVPIMIKTINTENVYKDLPCILVNDFKEILTFNNLEELYNHHMHIGDVTYKLTCLYWYDKLLSDGI